MDWLTNIVIVVALSLSFLALHKLAQMIGGKR